MSEAFARAERVARSLEHPYVWKITRDRGAELCGPVEGWVTRP